MASEGLLHFPVTCLVYCSTVPDFLYIHGVNSIIADINSTLFPF